MRTSPTDWRSEVAALYLRALRRRSFPEVTASGKTSNICELSLRHGRTPKLCNRSLHNRPRREMQCGAEDAFPDTIPLGRRHFRRIFQDMAKSKIKAAKKRKSRRRAPVLYHGIV